MPASFPSAVVYRDVMVPMRDGVRLATDVYLPSQDGSSPAAGHFHVLLSRTPYDKTRQGQPQAIRAAQRGYAVALQDVRGRYASEGEFRMMQDDSWGQKQDGFDTIVWLGRQPWSSGRVGMFGVSYLGAMQMLVAPMRPPYLTSCVSMQPASDEFTQRSFHNGALCLQDVERWAAGAAGENLVARAPEEQRQRAADEQRQYQELGSKAVEHLPLGHVPFLRLFPGLWQDVLDHWEAPSFFDANDATSRLQDIAIPICHIGGWYDFFVRNTITHFLGASTETEDLTAARGRANQHLIFGPWMHGGFARGEAGETQFPDAAFDDFGYALAWHDQWLRGIELPASLQPKVLLYVMGENRWRAEDAWPLPGTEVTDYYLHAGGVLSTERPAASEAADHFVYDPHHPLPSCGGNGPGFAGRNDFSQHLDRSDVLVYTTPPLAEPLELTGEISATLYAASSATDTDWTAKLLDVQPDGKAYHVAGGIQRARYRHSRTEPQPLTPGAVERYEVNMWATSTVFPAGHCIRLVISSSDFPVHDRNPNVYADLTRVTERHFVVATQTVQHNATQASCVHLPVIPANRERKWVPNPMPLAGLPAQTAPKELPASSLPA